MYRIILSCSIFLIIPLLCLPSEWENYTVENPEGELFYHDGFIWGKSGNGLWRYSPDQNSYELLYPSDWSSFGGKIISHLISRDGDIWFVIEDIGIIKYDGINWKLYDIRDDMIFSPDYGGIAEDTEGRIWISVKGGLAFLENDHFKLIYYIDGYYIRYEKYITCNKNGNLYLIFRSDDERCNIAIKIGDIWQVYPCPSEYTFHSSLLFADSKGTVWFKVKLDSSIQIIKFFNSTFTPINWNFPYKLAMTESSSGDIWIAARQIIYKVTDDNINHWKSYNLGALYQLISVSASGITTLNDGSVWALVKSNSVSNFDYSFAVLKDGDLSRQDFNVNIPLICNLVSLSEEHGILSSGREVLVIKDIEHPRALIFYEFPELKSVYDILYDSSDRIWITGFKGLISIKDNSITYHHLEAFWPSDRCTGCKVVEAPDKTIWTALYDSINYLFYYGNDIWEEAPIKSAFGGFGKGMKMTIDTRDIVWFINSDKLRNYYDGDVSTIDLTTNAKDVSADGNGGVWLATVPYYRDLSESGLCYINGDEINLFQESNGIPSHYITIVEVAPDNSVWFVWRDIYKDELGFNIPTTGGIGRFDGIKTDLYRPSDGLASYHIDDIAISSKGYVWCATELGLSTLNLNKEPEPKIKLGLNKHLLKSGDHLKLGLSLQNRGTSLDVNLLVTVKFGDLINYFNFFTGQFTDDYTYLNLTLPEDLKLNVTFWEAEIPDNFTGLKIEFSGSLLDQEASNLICDQSFETVKFM